VEYTRFAKDIRNNSSEAVLAESSRIKVPR
jgi:hypothetical protein